MEDLDKSTNSSSKVKVAVRLRPFNKRELDLCTPCVVDMKDDQTFLYPPVRDGKDPDRKQSKTFAFDHCFWSMDSQQTDKFADQTVVFNLLGVELLDNALDGYNACIFAYGQTGSGKSYTMMGSHEQPGLIPRLCDALFLKIHTETKADQSFKVEVSYMEIYNEKVRDLLDPQSAKQHLKVREHKLLGPYVDGLQQLLVSSAEDVQEFMSEGNKSRTVAATKMNAESSRSHAVFTLVVTRTMTDLGSGVSGERVSKLSLVDLAGSERSSKTGATGARLKEGSNINKSLTTLGLVISALADQASGKAKKKFVPYRDSILTWILKDNLGGNSRTTMVATLSPSADNYEETLSTLRYADRAKRIVNKAVVNEDPNARIIRELREEVEKLHLQLKQSESMRAPDLKEKLEESEKLIQEISQTWEEKLRKTELVHKKHQETLEKMGISLETSGIKVEKNKCYLVNLNADPSLNENLVYNLKSQTLVGHSDESDVQLSGLGIASKHATMEVLEDENGTSVMVTPMAGARTCINGQIIKKTTALQHGNRILWGNNHFFRINIPKPIIKKSDISSSPRIEDIQKGDNESKKDATVQSANDSFVSYEFAQQEVLLNQIEAPIQETILSLEKEFHLLQKETGFSNDSLSTNASYGKLDDNEREKYELEIDNLRKQLTSSLQPGHAEDLSESGVDSSLSTTSTLQQHYTKWKNERERIFCNGISNLRESLARAHALSREANAIATEMEKDTNFTVTLRIPTCNLTPNRKRGTLLCEPAVQVIRQGKDCQVWSVEKLSNRLVDMRELYELNKSSQESEQNTMGNRSFNDTFPEDPFNESESSQILIGVANVFLSCLLQDAPLHYPLPIINQHGQVAGKLLVGVQRLSGSIPESMLYGYSDDASSNVNLKQDELNEKSIVELSSTPNSLGGSRKTKLLDVSDSPMHLSPISVTPNKAMRDSHQRKSSVSIMPRITCRVSILEAYDLPPTLSHFVECQYTFLDCTEVTIVPPDLSPEEVSPKHRSSLNIHFNHSMEFTCNVTEELVDKLASNASLAIEVKGHRDRYHSTIDQSPTQLSYNSGHSSSPPSASKPRNHSGLRNMNARNRGSSLLSEKNKSLKERWNEVLKLLQLEISIQELGDNSVYEPVEVLQKADVPCRGVFQLKQGQSRRIKISINPIANSGTLPLICESIASVYAGSICQEISNKHRNGLDSYQEHDLTVLREQWLNALDRRKGFLDKQIKRLTTKEDKTEWEKEQENRLLDHLVMLTEERNAVVAPAVNSGIPGAPASWDPPSSCEMHVPVIFLDLNAHPVGCEDIISDPAGLDSELPFEMPGTFIHLPFVRPSQTDFRGCVSCVVSWDSSLHDCLFMNRVTPGAERIYVIIKVHVRLSHPAKMDLVLRKRISIAVYKNKSFTTTLMRKMQGNTFCSSEVMYEIVSNIPIASSEGEDHETLAMLAASNIQGKEDTCDASSDVNSSDDEDTASQHFERYVMRATKSVDNILALDRIRQEVALRDSTFSRSDSNSDIASIMTRRSRAGRGSIFPSKSVI